MRLRPILIAGVLTFLLTFQLFTDSTYLTSYAANAIFRHNFHEVVPGRFYRSAQMSRDDLSELVSIHHIKSVIDLRLDDDAPDDTGLTEADAARRGGATYRHIPFSSSRADQRDGILDLISAYHELPQPILVHCSSGSHRSGVASAIWLIEAEHMPPHEAQKQLSLKYGYFQLERDWKAFWQKFPTLDRVISTYTQVRAERDIPFETWVKESRLLDPRAGAEPPKSAK